MMKAKRPRNPGMFRPGRSGNPSGRPKKTLELARIEDLARQHSHEAIAALIDEARHGKGAPRVTAAIAILDRGWGKPVERQEQGPAGAFRDTSDRAAIIAAIEQRLFRLGVVKALKKQQDGGDEPENSAEDQVA